MAGNILGDEGRRRKKTTDAPDSSESATGQSVSTSGGLGSLGGGSTTRNPDDLGPSKYGQPKKPKDKSKAQYTPVPKKKKDKKKSKEKCRPKAEERTEEKRQ